MKNVNMINPIIKNIIIESWQIYKNNYVIIIQMIFLMIFIIGLGIYVFEPFIVLEGGLPQLAAQDESMNLAVLIFFLSFILFIMGMYLGAFKISLLLNKNKNINIKMIFSCFDYILIYAMGQILVFLPFIFISVSLNNSLIIVNRVIEFLFIFFPLIIIDQQINNPINSLKQSYRMVINNLNLTLPFFILLNISLVFFMIFPSVLTMLFTIFVLFPLSILCQTRLYLFINKKLES